MKIHSVFLYTFLLSHNVIIDSMEGEKPTVPILMQSSLNFKSTLKPSSFITDGNRLKPSSFITDGSRLKSSSFITSIDEEEHSKDSQEGQPLTHVSKTESASAIHIPKLDALKKQLKENEKEIENILQSLRDEKLSDKERTIKFVEAEKLLNENRKNADEFADKSIEAMKLIGIPINH